MSELTPDIIRRISQSEQRLDDLIEPEIFVDLIGPTLALPGLRGFWPMSGFDSGGDTTDMGGLAHHLTYNGNPIYNYDNLVPYIDLDGTGDFLSHADHADFDIFGTETYVAAAVRGLTLGGWFWIDALGANSGLIGKHSGVPGAGGYLLQKLAAADVIRFLIDDGVAQFVSGNTATITAATWYHVVGRFDPSNEVTIFLNGVSSPNAAGIPAAIGNSAVSFEISGFNNGASQLLDGRPSLCWICAEYHSDDIITAHFESTRAAYRVL